jgi:DNA-binding NtrC family response regulator
MLDATAATAASEDTMPAKQNILVADPDSDFLDWAKTQLAADDVEVITAETAEDAFRLFSAEKPVVTITEMRLGKHSGLELLARLRKRDPNALVIITGALGTTQSVIESMRLGAFDFVRKEQLPFNLKIVVDTAIRAAAEMQRAQKFEPSLTVEQHEDSIVGQSPAMQDVFKMVGRISNSDASVVGIWTPTKPLSAAHFAMVGSELNGASGPTNCARKIPGPFMVFMGRPQTVSVLRYL